MLLYVFSVMLSFLLLCGTAIVTSRENELTMNRLVLAVVLAVIPFVNAGAVVICAVIVMTELLENNFGPGKRVVFKWKRDANQ